MRDAMTERFENLFARLAQRRAGAFVPFVNLCDPDPETSLAVLETLVASGADALELGIPFSDPCAAGPVHRCPLEGGQHESGQFRREHRKPFVHLLDG